MVKLKPLIPAVLAILFTFVVYWKLPAKGLVPIPGDLLVGRFYPWNTQGWQDYPPGGVPYKEFISADTIRQTYPWRLISIEQIKQGRLPWWNPYSFSGTPLLANLQSAPFYPFNFLYWLTDFNRAWIIQVILQPILALAFTYLFCRSLKLSQSASLFAGISFAFAGYITTWLELNTVGHAALWLPFILWTINQAKQSNKYYFLTAFGFISSIFANHIQTTLYIFIIATAYALFRYINISKSQTSLNKKPASKKTLLNYQYINTLLFSPQTLKPFFLYLISLSLALAVASVQLLPAYQLFKLSPRSEASLESFQQFLVPPKHLVTFLSPNFFGNPATRNFWGQDYNEFMAYFGVIAFALALISIFSTKKTPTEKFFITAFFLALVFAVKNPVAYLPFYLKLPILSSSAPSRALFLVQFSGSILAGFGFSKAFKQIKPTNRAFFFLALVFAGLWVYALINWAQAADIDAKNKFMVSLRNLAIPAASFAVLFGTILLNRLSKSKIATHKLKLILFIPALYGSSVFANKYLPFSDPEFIFPSVIQFDQLKSIMNQDRFFGDYTASVTSNVWIPDHLYSAEGYDSLYLERYGQLLAAAANQGRLPGSVPRSDANLPPNQEDIYRQRLQDLLGVKYILDKNDEPKSDWEPDILRFPKDRYQLIWQKGRFKIYQNLQALPRVFLTSDFIVESSDQKILDHIYNPEFDLSQTVILEQPPEISAEGEATGSSRLVSYQPNQIELEVSSTAPQLLFLSDTYYPGWQARVGESRVPIYRADFAFRAIVVPEGSHRVTFSYSPSFLH